MDYSAFLPTAPGRLVEIVGRERAFVPAPLPPQWTMPSHLWPKLVEARCAMSLLEGIGRQVAQPEVLLKPIQDSEALKSSALEGTYATPEELLLYELDQSEVKSQQDPTKNWREVFNYTRALQYGLTSKLPLCTRLFREMHGLLLNGVRGDEKLPGEWRRSQVYIGTNHRFIPPPIDEMISCLDQLEQYIHDSESKSIDPLIRCYLIHYQFETIHPFTDGNGRIGRLILALMTHMWCGFSKPWLYMSAFFERNKDEYISKLFRVSAQGDWDGWIEFCLDGTISRSNETIKKCDKLRSLREDFLNRIHPLGGDTRIVKLVNHLFASSFVRVSDVSRLLDITYPTAKSDIDRLISVKILSEIPGRPIKTYYSPEVFSIAFKDD